MGIVRIDLVSLQVRDWRAAVRWYTEVLGLTVGPYEEEDQFCMLKTREGDVMLALASDHPEYSASQEENRCAPSFFVEHLDATLDELRKKGVRIDPKLDGDGDGYRLARIWDPEGNRISLFEYR